MRWLGSTESGTGTPSESSAVEATPIPTEDHALVILRSDLPRRGRTYCGGMELRRFLQRHGDLLIAAGFAVGYVLELTGYPEADLPIAIPLALGAAASMAVRRKAPLAVFLIVLGLDVGVLHWAPGFDNASVTFLAIFLFNFYSLGANARGVEAWLGALCVLVSLVGFGIGDGGFNNAADVFLNLALIGTPWAAGLVVRLRGDRVRDLRATNLALQEENAHAVATERARIARELHDVVSHAIAVTVLQARGGAKLVGRDDAAVRRALAAIEQTNTSALADMRRLLALLRDTDEDLSRPEPQPSLDMLGQLVDQVRESGLPVDLEISGEPLPVPPGLDLSAYRIVQEALTNVLKHAGPRARARVELTYGSDDLQVAVTNIGALVAPVGAGGQGLIGIRERVAVAGGSVEAGPAADGFAVCARLPYVLGTA